MKFKKPKTLADYFWIGMSIGAVSGIVGAVIALMN